MHPLDQLRNFFAGTDDGYILNGIVPGSHPSIAFRDVYKRQVVYWHQKSDRREGATMADVYKQSFKQSDTNNIELSIFNCGLELSLIHISIRLTATTAWPA